jgi:hypothetical protein
VSAVDFLGKGTWPKPAVDFVKGLIVAGNPNNPAVRGFVEHMLADNEGKYGTKHYPQAVRDEAVNLLMQDNAFY